MVEAALSLVLFLTLLFGIMEFGRLIYSYNTLAHATREGTRYALARGQSSPVPATSTTIATLVQRQAVGLKPVTVTTTWTPDNKPGSLVQVDATYTFNPILPYTKLAAITLRSTSKMRISQ
jgi:Flp pilus assembly protein TadG